MKRILYVFLTTLALLLLLSGCSSRHSESGSSHDETSVLTVELSSDSVSDSELKAFEEEVLTIHSDLQTEEMTVEAFKDLYHTSLPTLSQVPASYHQVDSVFVKAGEYRLSPNTGLTHRIKNSSFSHSLLVMSILQKINSDMTTRLLIYLLGFTIVDFIVPHSMGRWLLSTFIWKKIAVKSTAK